MEYARATTAPTRSTVVLVDVAGEVVGTADKLDAHAAPGALHLAFSVFLYRAGGEMLLQRRAASKYHFPLFWANACCSHPDVGEELLDSAERRVVEELGVGCTLVEVGSFIYRATCPVSGRVEHELDHVLIGRIELDPAPAPSEVDATCWMSAEQLRAGLPLGEHAPWLAEAMELAEAGRLALGW